MTRVEILGKRSKVGAAVLLFYECTVDNEHNFQNHLLVSGGDMKSENKQNIGLLIANICTGLGSALVAVLIAGSGGSRMKGGLLVPSAILPVPRQEIVDVESIPELRTCVFAAVSLFALSNLFGIPKKTMERHWKNSAFGQEFFGPFLSQSTASWHRKGMVAGAVEGFAIGLSLTQWEMVRAVGYAVVFLMYGRAALVHASLPPVAVTKALVCALISLSAGLLMMVELEDSSSLAAEV